MYFFFSFTETQKCATTSRDEEEACRQSMKQNLNCESVFVCWMLHIKQLNGEKARKNNKSGFGFYPPGSDMSNDACRGVICE